jgi:16S rRNA (cytidine1402-2'-O)-methyltransferase
VPGPSALTAAIALSGLVEGPFQFLAFLPRKGRERAAALASVRDSRVPSVFFESPQRAQHTLAELAELAPERRGAVCRELTKLHEELCAGSLTDLAGIEAWRGELTLVVAGADEPAAPAAADVEAMVRERLAAGERPKEIAAALAGSLGLSRRDVYAMALRAQENPSDSA